tara:strand:+ start:5682 stop:6413 length:732 start_codon:yes stop_codon:yes gene_type:complete
LTSETELVVHESPPEIPESPTSEIQIIERIDYLVDRIHKCEQEKLIYLLEIHQNKYWTQDFGSFEQFCKERLGYSKQYVYRCITAAKMIEAGVPVENPNQSLALEGLDVEQAKEVWDKAQEAAEESGKKVSGGMLKQARKEKDVYDRAVYGENGSLDISGLQEPFKEIVATLRTAKDLLQGLCQSPEAAWVSYQPLAIKLRDVAETVKFAMPHSVCTGCGGPGCEHCKTLGWIPKARTEVSEV